MHQWRNKKLAVTKAAFLSSSEAGLGGRQGLGRRPRLRTQLLKQGRLDA